MVAPINRAERQRGDVERGETEPAVPELPELRDTEVIEARKKMMERAAGERTVLQASGAEALRAADQAAVQVNPSDRQALSSIEQRAAEAEYALLQKLDAAKRELDDATETYDKSSGMFSVLTKSRRTDRTSAHVAMREAETKYQQMLDSMQHTDSGRKAVNLHLTREMMSTAEADLKRSSGLRGLFSGERSSKKDEEGKTPQDHKREYASYMREQYEKGRAEIVGTHVSAVLTEQTALADTRATEMKKQDLELYRLHKSLGDANLSNLLSWEPTSRLGKIVGKSLNARTAINLALVGGGIGLAASGGGFVVGAAAGSLYLTRRLMGGAAAGAGAYDLLRMRRSAKIEKAIASQRLKDLSDEQLLEASAQLESQSMLNGTRVSNNETYKRIQAEKEVRMVQLEKGLAEKAGELKIAMQSLIAQTDKQFDAVRAADETADRKLRAIGLAVGVFVGSGMMVETLKGAAKTVAWAAEATGADRAVGSVAKGILDAAVGTAHAEPLPESDLAAAEADPGVVMTEADYNQQQLFDTVATHVSESGTGSWNQDGITFTIKPDGHLSAEFGDRHLDLGTRENPVADNWKAVIDYAEAQPKGVEPATTVAAEPPVRITPRTEATVPDRIPEPPPVTETATATSQDYYDVVRNMANEGGKWTAGHGVEFTLLADGNMSAKLPDGTAFELGTRESPNTDNWQTVTDYLTNGPAVEEATPTTTGVEVAPPVEKPPTAVASDVQPPESTEPPAVEAAPAVELPTGAYLSQFFDSSATSEARGEALKHVMDRMGHNVGPDRSFSMRNWNVRFFSDSSGQLSYAMRGADGSVISEKIPLRSDADWQNLSKYMHTEGEHLSTKRPATGLFQGVHSEPHFTPGKVAGGIRTADAALDRAIDAPFHKLEDWIQGEGHADPERVAAELRAAGRTEEEIAIILKRLEVTTHEELPLKEGMPHATHADRVGAREAAGAARKAAADAKGRAALDAAEAQRAAIRPPSEVNPAAQAAAVAEINTGKVTLPSGMVVEFEPHGRGNFRIQWDERTLVSRDVATARLFNGDEYMRIIRHYETTDPAGKIRAVEEQAVKLASLMQLRDYMVANGLSERPEFAEVQETIAKTKTDVSRFGHVIVDDPDYGKPSGGQVAERFVSFHKGRVPMGRDTSVSFENFKPGPHIDRPVVIEAEPRAQPIVRPPEAARGVPAPEPKAPAVEPAFAEAQQSHASLIEKIKASGSDQYVNREGVTFQMQRDGSIQAYIRGRSFDLGTTAKPNIANVKLVTEYHAGSVLPEPATPKPTP